MPSIPTKELPAVAWKRVLREIRSRTAPNKPREIKVGSSIQEIAAQIRERQRPRFFGVIPEQAALIGQFFPDAYYEILNQADKVLTHKFDVLGSGEVDLGWPIDWHCDFKSGHKWPLDHHIRLTLTSKDGGFDIKVPWELSRFHQTVRLGQAYLLTLDEAYAREAVAQIEHWIKANPIGFGVNWAGPMDVAIRAVNWIWTYYMILESEALNEKFLGLWLTSFKEHGEYIAKNLEDGWPRTNHLIANLVGLAYLGIMFPEFDDAKNWREIGLKRLWSELENQINPDGMDYEASTSYHRLVTELGLSAAALCIANDIEVPEVARARLRSMLDVIMAYTPPNGRAPLIGDADNGRLLPLGVHTDIYQSLNDHRHLLALGSLVLEREANDWAGFVNPGERGWSVVAGMEWQDAFWYFTSDAAARFTEVLAWLTPRPQNADEDDWVDVGYGFRVRARALSPRPVTVDDFAQSRGFEASGLYVMRNENVHVAVDAGEVGQDGVGGHAHNDVFSFTLSAYNHQYVIDPGSYLYTSNPKERNLFRSTLYHNVLQIDDYEINRIPEDEMFRLENDARIVMHRWVSHKDFDLLDVSHTGYERLNPSIRHRRRFWFEKNSGILLVHDIVVSARNQGQANGANGVQRGTSNVPISLRFHFAPMPVHVEKEHQVLNFSPNGGAGGVAVLSLEWADLKTSFKPGWYSPGYGVKDKSNVLTLSGRANLPFDLILAFVPYSGSPDYKTIHATSKNALMNMRRAFGSTGKTGRLTKKSGVRPG